MHLALDAWQLGEGFGRVSQQAGGGMVGRAVAPFPRKLHASHQGHTAVKPVTRAGRIRHAHHTAAQAACLHLGLGGGVHIAHICHGLNSSADGRRRGLARETQHHALGVWRLDGAAQRLQRLARCARRAVTQAHQHHAAGCDGWHLVQLQMFARFGGQISVLERQGRHGGQRILAGLEALGKHHDQQVAFLRSCRSKFKGLEIKVHNWCFPSSQCYSIHPSARSWRAASARPLWCW